MTATSRQFHLQKNNRATILDIKPTVLVTGAADFIGSNVCSLLLAREQQVIGLDHLNVYYNVRLMQARLAQSKKFILWPQTR
jgi:nucleoside-diphosphate-sugar epimerase